VALFGCVPEPGRARGEYIKKMKSAFSDRLAAALAYELVSKGAVDFRFLAHGFPSVRFGDAIERIANLQLILRSGSARPIPSTMRESQPAPYEGQ
jgi:hypothetical protein